MAKVNCSVESCSYNSNNKCVASSINVGGKGVGCVSETCCGSYLNKLGYSNLAQTLEKGDGPAEILCRVNTCVYNKCDKCSLNEINIGAQGKVEVYTQTDCLSFQEQ